MKEQAPIETLIADLDKMIEVYESFENTHNALKSMVLKSIKNNATKLLQSEKERDNIIRSEAWDAAYKFASAEHWYGECGEKIKAPNKEEYLSSLIK